MFRFVVRQLVHGQSGGMPWIVQAEHHKKFSYQEEIREIFKRHRVAFDERMFGIEIPKGRTPLQLQGATPLQLQGASLDVTSPRAKAPGLFC
jgi:hypothetical protein